MNDPYKQVFESISEAIKKHTEMIVWIAERTLSVKEYKEFIDEFENKRDDKREILKFVKREGQH